MVSRVICIHKVRGSIPRVSKFSFLGICVSLIDNVHEGRGPCAAMLAEPPTNCKQSKSLLESWAAYAGNSGHGYSQTNKPTQLWLIDYTNCCWFMCKLRVHHGT